MRIEDLTDEQIAKARECKSADELVALAKAEGVELTSDQLDAVAGGSLEWNCETECYEDAIKNCIGLDTC